MDVEAGVLYRSTVIAVHAATFVGRHVHPLPAEATTPPPAASMNNAILRARVRLQGAARRRSKDALIIPPEAGAVKVA
jgi:hypothetical protein